MSGKQQIDYGDDEQFLAAYNREGPSKVAVNLGVSRGAVQAHRKKLLIKRSEAEVELPGVHTNPDGSASVVQDATNQPPAPWKPEELLRAHGLDPKEWEIARVRGNRWGDPGDPKHQLRVDVIPRSLLIALPDPAKWTKPPKPRKRKKQGPEKVVICGDHHAPHHDKTLHALFLEWLAEEQPDRGVLLGDILDFATVSRHRERDGFANPVNEGLEAAFGILTDYRHASPDTRWTLLRGNHDDRLYHQIIDNIRGLHNLKAADDEVPALSLRRLLHLDDLGIELVDEDWDRGKTKITRRFTARHGYTASKNSTEQMLTKLAHSTVQGHTHRLSVRYRTEHDDTDAENPTETRLAAEAGCMCEIHEGLGYATDPDWQNGFLVCHAYADDDFQIEPAIYVPGRLLAPGGKRFVASHLHLVDPEPELAVA